MSSKGAKPKGGRPKSPDSAQRNQQVQFRMGNIHRELIARIRPPVGSGRIAVRDLSRYYGVVRAELRGLGATPADVRAVADYLQHEIELTETGSAELLSAVVLTAATAVEAKALTRLTQAQAVALMDLIQRASTPDEAAEIYAQSVA